jgi:hypothetical protein
MQAERSTPTVQFVPVVTAGGNDWVAAQSAVGRLS